MIDRRWAALLQLPLAAFAIPAAAEDYLSTEQAQRVLFPEADHFDRIAVTLSDEQIEAIEDIAGVRQRERSPRVWQAQKAGASLGWLFVDEVIGKHEYITYAAAISPDGHVLGIEIMSYRETHGGEIRDVQWRNNFRGKTLADKFKLEVDIPNISGATLSCRNVTDGVKRLLALRQVALAK